SSPNQNSHLQTASATHPPPQTESSIPPKSPPRVSLSPVSLRYLFLRAPLQEYGVAPPSLVPALASYAQNPRPTLFPSPCAATRTPDPLSRSTNRESAHPADPESAAESAP